MMPLTKLFSHPTLANMGSTVDSVMKEDGIYQPMPKGLFLAPQEMMKNGETTTWKSSAPDASFIDTGRSTTLRCSSESLSKTCDECYTFYNHHKYKTGVTTSHGDSSDEEEESLDSDISAAPSSEDTRELEDAILQAARHVKDAKDM